MKVHLLDYGAGNVRSVENAIKKCGHEVITVTDPDEILKAEVLVFPGVGSFGNAMKRLIAGNYVEPLKEYIKSDRKFMGICLGMQTLFEGSEEDPEYQGLGIIPGTVRKFNTIEAFNNSPLSVPHIGWNSFNATKSSCIFSNFQELENNSPRAYFVHSYCALPCEANKDWVLCTTFYGVEFISAIQKGNVLATQFHPEKSGTLGIEVLRGFLDQCTPCPLPPKSAALTDTCLSRRVIACLDVRKNDDGDLVVTKGDGYDVREKKADDDANSKGKVRNFGKPVQIARRYYEEHADEITFLNITQFREDTLEAESMHEMLRCVSENVFVPLTIGGGIRDYGTTSALEVADKYFRSGADKVSLGSYAVEAVLKLRNELGNKGDGSSAIEKISHVYGAQAVVISVDPRRIFIESQQQKDEVTGLGYAIFEVADERTAEEKRSYNSWLFTSVGKEDQSNDPSQAKAMGCSIVDEAPRNKLCWFQCTVAGGRQRRPLDAIQLVRGCEVLGAGEILLNSIDKDGKNSGFDLVLVKAVRDAINLPVIASSGAGAAEHFVQVFENTSAEAALAAGIFHRQEVAISDVKARMHQNRIPVRL